MTLVAVIAGIAALTVAGLLFYVVTTTEQWIRHGKHHLKPPWPRRHR